MADARLSHDEFFDRLTRLLADCASRGHGSVYLVQKQLTHNLSSPEILIRATDGKSQTADRKKTTKQKFTTQVRPDDLSDFYGRYAETCKAGMQSLKKRDRSKRKKTKKAKA